MSNALSQDATRAHAAVMLAVRRGELVPEPCEQADGTCKGAVHAHHDDYGKPLDVRWLCRRHHALHHQARGGTARVIRAYLTDAEWLAVRTAAIHAGQTIGDAVADALRKTYNLEGAR